MSMRTARGRGGLLFATQIGLTLVACVAPVPAGGGGGGGSNAGAGGGNDGGAEDGGRGPTATGIDCTVQTSSTSPLCVGISSCPGVTVNQNALALCGFRVSGSALDIECECTGYLCPAGATPTCAAASALISETNSVAVCNELSTGGCTFEAFLGGQDAGTTACDTTCESGCVGDPTCIQACGC